MSYTSQTAQATIQSLIRSALKAAVLSSVAGYACAASTLLIDVQDVVKSTGTLMIKLVNSEAAYGDKAEPVSAQMIDVTKAGAVQVRFDDLAPGTYAVMIMHDENNNGKLDSNIIGIPKEGYGFSNNPNVMRQPTFDEVKFEVKDRETKIVINII